ncbi:LytR/AlgR family response regulator transcription factor [Myroides sp. LJL115]
MKKLTCYILEDEPQAISLLEQYILKIPALELIGSSTSALQGVVFLQDNPVDLVFIDIQMPDLTGIQVMSILGSNQKYIITSAYSEYALEGYKHNVLDYLLKPISFNRFFSSYTKVKNLLESFIVPKDLKELYRKSSREQTLERQEDFLFIKTDLKWVKIALSDILFVQGLKDYLQIHLENEKLISLGTMQGLLDKLKGDNFMRIHKSYIINLARIDSIERNRLFIQQHIIPIGSTYQGEFQQWFEGNRC